MKKLISLFLILSQLLPATTLAAISAPDRADIPAPINSVVNSSGQRGLAGWVKGGTPGFSVVTTAGNKAAGVASFALDAASISDYVETGALTLTDDTTGDCEASISVKGNATGYTLQLMSGTDILNSIALTNNAGFKPHAFNYPCASGYKLRVASSGDNAAINFGAVYWGKATNIGMVNPVTDPTSYSPTVTGVGVSSSNLVWWRAGKFMIIQGKITVSGVPTGTVLFSLPPGYSLDTAYLPRTTYAKVGSAGLFLGASGGDRETYDITQDNTSTTTFRFGGMNSAGVNGVFNASFPAAWQATDEISIKEMAVPILGWTAQTAVRQDQTFDRTGEIMAIAGACPMNTVSAMNKTIGKASGDYQGDSYLALYAKMWRADLATSGQGVTISSAAGASATADWAAGKTLKLDFTDLFLRGIGTSNTKTGQYQDDRFQGHWHQTYNSTPASGQAGYSSIMEIQNTGGANASQLVRDPISDGVNGTPRTAAETRPKNVGVNYCVNYTGTQPAPVLVGSVTSNTSGMERVERATITLGAPCAVTSQSGSWITGISGSAGVCTLTFATGAFSAAPTCVATNAGGNNTGYVVGSKFTSASSTGVVITTSYVNTGGGGGAAAEPTNLICMGPR